MIRRIRSGASLAIVLGALGLLAPQVSSAAITTFGSQLSAPATLNTSTNLGYTGSSVAIPPGPLAPNGIYHVYHYGVDSALWNVGQLSDQQAQVPGTGQALKVALEGCAEAAPGGPAPLTQVHFQDLSPLSGGGARVSLTSQGFNVPVCGQNGASGTTVTSYEPINLCVSAGDYVALNTEGGFVPGFYPFGVPYRVLGSAHGSTMNSFLRNNGTGNGAVMSPTDLGADDGFAVNHGEELMLQVTLGTGKDATHICAGGTAGLAPVKPPITVGAQTDGINAHSVVAVAVYCRLRPMCTGVATLTVGGKQASAGKPFTVPGNSTAHVPMQVSSRVLGMIRRFHGVRATLTAVVGSTTVSQTITVKIF